MVNPRSCLVTFFVVLLLASIASIFFEYDQVRTSTPASMNLDGRTNLPKLSWKYGELDIANEDLKLDSETILQPIVSNGGAAQTSKKNANKNPSESILKNKTETSRDTNEENVLKSADDIVVENVLESNKFFTLKKVENYENTFTVESSRHDTFTNSKQRLDTKQKSPQNTLKNSVTNDPLSAKRRVMMRARARSEDLKENIRDACDTLDISLRTTSEMLRHMLVDDERKVMYCFVPKVACTSWRRIWMRMVGLVGPKEDISKIDRNIVHRAKIPSLKGQSSKYIYQVLTTYKKYMFVRHPFDRALSAYRDKFENREAKSEYSFHKDIGVKIKAKYNPGYHGNGDGVTFTEFMDYITDDEYETNLTSGQKNEHWLPVHDLCNPCFVHYDFVGKYETLKEDADYVLDWIGVTDLPQGFPASDRPFHAKRYDPRYFDQLTHNLRMSFFHKYLEDFIALNYTFV